MPRYDAGDRLITLMAIADSDSDLIANAKPLATARMVDDDLNRPHRDRVASLPRPREVPLRVAAEAAGEDVLECGTLLGGRLSVEVQDPGPGGARLVVAVAARQSNRKTSQVDTVRVALLDQPREDSHADTMGRAPTRDPINPTARTDCVAVTRLKVRSADSPTHRPTSHRIACTVSRSGLQIALPVPYLGPEKLDESHFRSRRQRGHRVRVPRERASRCPRDQKSSTCRSK